VVGIRKGKKGVERKRKWKIRLIKYWKSELKVSRFE